MHHITSSVTYRDLKLLELNFTWEATNQMMRLLIEQKSPDSFLNQVILKILWCIKSVLWTRSRRILSAYTGVWGSPNKRFVAMDSHEHCLLILYKAKTKNFFKRFHRISFNHKLRQAGLSYIQSRNACWSHAPNPVNCDVTSQAVYCGI